MWVAWVYKMLERAKSQNFGVGETYGFMNFYYDSTKFYLWF